MVIMWRKVRERNLTVEISRNADWAMTLIGSHAFDNLPVYKRNQTAWFCRINKVAYEERPESIGSRGNCLDNGCQRKNLWLIGALAEKADALSIVPCCLSIMLVFSSLLYIYIYTANTWLQNKSHRELFLRITVYARTEQIMRTP